MEEDLGSIFGVEKEDVASEEEEATNQVAREKALDKPSNGPSAAGFSTPQPTPSIAAALNNRRGRSASPKRRLDFGSDDDEGASPKSSGESSNGPAGAKRVAKRQKRGASLPTPILTVSRADEDEGEGEGEVAGKDDDEHPRRSPRKPPPTRRFDPAKTGLGRLSKRKRSRSAAEEEADEGSGGKNKKGKKARPGKGKGKKRKNESENEEEEEDKKEEKEEEDDDEGDKDSDEDFSNARKGKSKRINAERKKRKTESGSADKKSPKKSPKKVLADEREIKEKVKEEMAALSEYFADVDDTPLEEEEPPGTKWVSMPMLKSPQRLERLAKYPTIAKDYDEYKKALKEAHVEPAPITEFVKNMEDKRLEAVIQP